jgi:hypothetical protein
MKSLLLGALRFVLQELIQAAFGLVVSAGLRF